MTERGEVYEQINLATASGKMEYYSNCINRITALTTLDLSSFNTINVTNMNGMFTCLISDNSNRLYFYYNNSSTTRSSLKTIYVYNLWDVSKVATKIIYMRFQYFIEIAYFIYKINLLVFIYY